MEDLVGAMAKGCKPREAFRVGAEHEKFGYRKGSFAPIPYDGETGIHALLTGLMRFGWTGVHAATAWLLSVPLIVAAVYFPLRPALRRVSTK